MLSSAVTGDQSRLGAKIRVNLTSYQVTTALPGHQGQTCRLSRESGKDDAEKELGWVWQAHGPDLAVGAGNAMSLSASLTFQSPSLTSRES